MNAGCRSLVSGPYKVVALVRRRVELHTPVAVVFENLEDGMTIDEVMQQFPVTREQVTAVLEFAARSLDAPVPGR